MRLVREVKKKGDRRDNLLKHTGQFIQILRCISASVASKKDYDNTAFTTPIPFPSALSRKDHRALPLPPLRFVQCQRHAAWILSSLATTRHTHRVRRAVSGKCPWFADLGCCYLPFPVQPSDFSSPQENQPEEHLHQIPVLRTTLSVALANQSTCFPLVYIKPWHLPSAPQDTHSFQFSVTSKPLFKWTGVAHIYLARERTLLYAQHESELQ